MGSMRTHTKLFVGLAVFAGAAGVVLGCYAFFIKTQAESLLKGLSAITVEAAA